MRKVASLFLLCVAFSSCKQEELVPIEKLEGKNYIIVKIQPSSYFKESSYLWLKNKDTIIYSTVFDIDLKNRDLKVGDTIK